VTDHVSPRSHKRGTLGLLGCLGFWGSSLDQSSSPPWRWLSRPLPPSPAVPRAKSAPLAPPARMQSPAPPHRPPGRRPRPPRAHALLDQSAGAPSCPIHGNLNIKLSCRSNYFACRSNPFACRSNYFACRSKKINNLIPKSWLTFIFLHHPTSFYLITL
jgi:hypothetical protein